jgi:hypothetical protein
VIRTTKDGRTIRSGRDYTDFRFELWEINHRNCWECNRSTSISADLAADNSFHVHHKRGRGMGGALRDDTFLACSGICGKCHRIRHGQQSAVQSQPQWSKRA